MQQALTLRQLNLMVCDAIEMHLSDEYWVQAELAECREHGGHCYMELIERDDRGSTPIARASAKCWRQTWTIVKPHFERTTGQPLHAGMKVMLKVYAQFHEAYGFSWIVSDIDPTYTIGDQARRRQEIIKQLKEEGVFDLQHELQLPLFCQRIAVISSATAAGYGDFCRQLEDNAYGFYFHTELFEAIMQGEQVEQSIIAALNRIYSVEDAKFDCVVIIRGGGATADLSGFDTLALAENVANFPIPIITGIGHERDESILDLVAWRSVKTPTAAAAFFIDRLLEVSTFVDETADRLSKYASKILHDSSIRLSRIASSLSPLSTLVMEKNRRKLQTIAVSFRPHADLLMQRKKQHLEKMFSLLPPLSELYMQRCIQRVDNLAVRTRSADPKALLRRGYSITTFEGKIVRNPKDLSSGQEIETQLEKGKIKSIIK